MKKTIRWIAALLVLVMLVPTLLIPAGAAAVFEDVSAAAWYTKAVNYVYEKGYMFGVGEGRFAPNDPVTRGMFVTVLARLAGAETDNARTVFSDVPTNTWYTGAVTWAAEQGIVAGVGGGRFNPGASITRQDMCAILSRFLGTLERELPTGESRTFSDADKISSYAKNAVALCSASGLIAGFDDGTFRPAATATRAQTAAILMRLDQLLTAEPVDPVEPMPAQTFNAETGDLTVTVDAPKGALPEKTAMVASVVNDARVLSAISDQVSGRLLAAVDISFHNVTGEIEPENEVSVSIALEGLENVGSLTVIHVTDDGAVEEVSGVTRDRTESAVRFRSKQFSVYAVVDVTAFLAVNFLKGTDLINTQYVTKNASGVGKVYDPGVELGNYETFLGWAIGSVSAAPVDIDAVNAYISANWTTIQAARELNVYAITKGVRYVVYYDENGRVLKSQGVNFDDGTTPTVTVNQGYVPNSAIANFYGWSETKDSTTVQYANGDTLTMTQALTSLYPVVREGYWLSFDNYIDQDADATSASYTSPVFYEQTVNTAPPATPTRTGYTFGGWYTDKTFATAYSFGGKLEKDTTVYAKWTPAATTYQVNFWLQSRNDKAGLPDNQKTYDFYDAAKNRSVTTTRTATTGTQVSIQTSDTQLAGTGDLTYFVYNSVNTDTDPVTVKGDGSTVLNVYYDRRVITYNYWTSDSHTELYIDRYELGGDYYVYTDTFATGYYMIGKDGPLGSTWRPTEGTLVYSFDDLRKGNYTDTDYKGDKYFEYSADSPNANNIYTTSDENFTEYGGLLYHKHSYWLSTRYFAQFYYYENRSGTYAEGSGPEADITHDSTVSLSEYYCIYPTGYYLVGDPDGPLGDWTPSVGNTLYCKQDPNWESWTTLEDYDHFYSSGTFRPYAYTESGLNVLDNYEVGDTDTNNDHYKYHFIWNERNGYLFAYLRWENRWNVFAGHRYRPVYYYYVNNTGYAAGYYKVGEGPTPNAEGTHNYVQSTYTGLYGSDFTEWPALPSGQIFTDEKFDYPIPFGSFTITTYESLTIDFYPKSVSGSQTILILNLGQSVDGTGPDVEIAHGYSTPGGYWYPEEQYTGFTCDGYRIGSSGSWTPYSIPATGTGDPISIPSSGEINIHYARNQRNLIMESFNTEVVNQKIYYDANLTAYGTTDYIPTNGPEGYYFDGWYADPGFDEPFDFETTMPDNDVRVYAKWTMMRFRVYLDVTGGDTSINVKNDVSFPGGTQAATFRVDYGELIRASAIEKATREGYQLIGWFLDTDPTNNTLYDTAFNFNNPVTEAVADLSYATASDEARQGKDPVTGNEYSDVDKDNVVGKVTIYARWRKKMDNSTAINVVYDAMDGTVQGTQTWQDTLSYADNSQSITQPAAIPGEEGYVFHHWEIMKPTSATDSTLTSTGVELRPGDTFTILLENAVVTGTQEAPVYTVYLHASYTTQTSTHITWVGNGGVTADGSLVSYSPDAIENSLIHIKEADTFSYPGHTFLGWARLEEDDVKDGDGWALQNLAAQDLWLVWNPDTETYTINKTNATHSAEAEIVNGAVILNITADEQTPYHILYAVWSDCYYVFHANTGELEAVPMPEAADETVNLTEKVIDNTYYTGWFNTYGGVTEEALTAAKAAAGAASGKKVPVQDAVIYDGSCVYTNGSSTLQYHYDETLGKNVIDSVRFWKKADKGTQAGGAVTPEAGKVYYLKELPKTFFKTSVLFIYDVETKQIKDLYLVTAVDDGTLYSGLSLVVNGSAYTGGTPMLAASLTYERSAYGKDDGSVQASATVTPSSLFGIGAGGYLLIQHASSLAGGGNFTLTPSWTTLDGCTDHGTISTVTQQATYTESALTPAPATRARLRDVTNAALPHAVENATLVLDPNTGVYDLH